MKINNPALFIIDMQNDFVWPASPCCVAGAAKTIPFILKILNVFRENEYPVFHIIREYREDGSDIEKFRYQDFIEGKKYVLPNTKGCDIVEELRPEEKEFVIIKNRFSGFMNGVSY